MPKRPFQLLPSGLLLLAFSADGWAGETSFSGTPLSPGTTPGVNGLVLPILLMMAVAGVVYFKREMNRRTDRLKQEIAEHRKTEKALHLAVLRQNQAIQAGNVGLWDWDFKTDQVRYTVGWERQVAMAPKEICDSFSRWADRVHPEDRPKALNAIETSIDQRHSGFRFELRFSDDKGEFHWVFVQASFMTEASGEPVSAFGSFTDISKRKKFEAAIVHQKDTETALSDLATLLLTTTDLAEISYRVLQTAKTLTQSKYGFVGAMDPDSGHLICHTMTRDIWDECNISDKSIIFEKRAGLWGWVLDNREPVLVNQPETDPRANGTPDGHIDIQAFLGVPAMIGDRLVGQIALANPDTPYGEPGLSVVKRLAVLFAMAIQRQNYETALVEMESRKAEELEKTVQERTLKLSESKELLKKVYNSQIDAIFILDNYELPLILDCNKAAEKMFGYNREKMIGRPTAFLHVDTAHYKKVEALMYQRNCSGGLHYLSDFEMKRRDSSLFPTEITITRLNDDQKQHVGWVCVIHDVSQQKAHEDEIRQTQAQVEKSRNMLRALFDGISEPLVLMDEHGAIQMANKAAAEYYGMDIPELLGGPPCFALFRQSDRPCTDCPILESVAKGAYTSFFRTGFMNPNLTEQVTIFPITDLADHARSALVRIHDATAEKTMEAELIQADKMISLGILVSGVAHEINNPNNAIMLNAPLLKGVWESVRPILDIHYEETGDFETGGLPYSEMRLEFSSLLDDIELGAHRIERIVKDLKDYARRDEGEMNESVQINETVQQSLWLLSNLINKSTRNFSVHFGENLPSIRGNSQKLEQVVINLIQNACQAIETPDKAVAVSTGMDETTGFLFISVADGGPGIPEDAKQRILDPFFTTKRGMGGTGLGLSVSANIIKEHQGKIIFSSPPGEGATFTVFLPVERRKMVKKILLVDDDADIRDMFVQALMELGAFTVAQASNGVEAWAELLSDPPDLVILDMIMPEMNGIEICRMLKGNAQVSGIPVLIVTGFMDAPELAEAQALGFSHVLYKPFELYELVKYINDLMMPDLKHPKIINGQGN